jgi:hypothetical protein
MRLTSSNQRLGAGTDRGVQGNAIPENPAPVSPLPPNESSMKYRYKDYDSNLSEIIALPKITGTALVLAFGNEMECIRSLGDAPPIGSRGHAGVGLTGISFSSGKVELCNDVENDSRADLQACADLGVRSVLVVPIRHSSRVAGVLEALSSEPGAFDWRTIRHIRRLAQAFDPVTLESWVYSPERQDGLERAASFQNRSDAPVTPLPMKIGGRSLVKPNQNTRSGSALLPPYSRSRNYRLNDAWIHLLLGHEKMQHRVLRH